MLGLSALKAKLKASARAFAAPDRGAHLVYLTPYFPVEFNGNARPRIRVGEHSYCQGLIVHCWDPEAEIEIGRYCSIATDVMMLAGGNHDIDWVTTYPMIDRWGLKANWHLRKPRFKGPITLGHDVWIAARSTVVSGVTIGTGAVVGAGSIVTKDVPPYAIVAGNPARLIRYRFDADIIARLLRTQWWEKDRQTLSAIAHLLPDVQGFLSAVESETFSREERTRD